MLYEPLAREEVKATIEGRAVGVRVPATIHMWVHADAFNDRRESVLDVLSRYPMDVEVVGFNMPDMYAGPDDCPEFRWVNFDDPGTPQPTALDAKVVVADWEWLDGILEAFPSADYPGLIRGVSPDDGRYRMGVWWHCLFERHWSLRGMTNALSDYYTAPGSVHRLYRALTEFYKTLIRRGRDEYGLDGIFTSDDLGMQTAPFFSPAVFREFFKPYYAELIDHAHALDMHFWLHCCGDIHEFLPDLVDIGLDVIHPIQKHAMDEGRVAAEFGDRICVCSGIDVQQVIPWGTPDDVRAEVRRLIDTFHRPRQGKMILTAGNGVNGDCTLASLEAFFDETFAYGGKKARAGSKPLIGVDLQSTPQGIRGI